MSQQQIVILAHSADAGAHRIAYALGGAGRARVFRPEALALARWSHRVDSHGHASTHLSWPHDSLASSSIGAVLNRILYVPVPQFETARAKDRDYAGAEFQALVTSWLAGLGDAVVHPVRQHPWLVPNLPSQHWAESAAACGLPLSQRIIVSGPRAFRLVRHRSTPQVNSAPSGSVLVAGNRAAGTMAHAFGDRCLAAAHRLKFPLAQFVFAPDGLAAVDLRPPLLEPWACSITADLLRNLAIGRSPA